MKETSKLFSPFPVFFEIFNYHWSSFLDQYEQLSTVKTMKQQQKSEITWLFFALEEIFIYPWNRERKNKIASVYSMILCNPSFYYQEELYKVSEVWWSFLERRGKGFHLQVIVHTQQFELDLKELEPGKGNVYL